MDRIGRDAGDRDAFWGACVLCLWVHPMRPLQFMHRRKPRRIEFDLAHRWRSVSLGIRSIS